MPAGWPRMPARAARRGAQHAAPRRGPASSRSNLRPREHGLTLCAEAAYHPPSTTWLKLDPTIDHRQYLGLDAFILMNRRHGRQKRFAGLRRYRSRLVGLELRDACRVGRRRCDGCRQAPTLDSVDVEIGCVEPGLESAPNEIGV